MARGDVTRLAGRPRSSGRADGLALRRAMPDRLLPALVAAMTFLAALALSGAVGAALLAQRWSSGAASVLTVQVPDGDSAAAAGAGGSRVAAVLAVLQHDPAIAGAARLDQARLESLLAPWLGSGRGAQAGGQAEGVVDGGAGGGVGGGNGDPAGGRVRGRDGDLATGPAVKQDGDGNGNLTGRQDGARTGDRVGGQTSNRSGDGNGRQDGGQADDQVGDRGVSGAVLVPALVLPAVIQARLRPGVVAPGDLDRRLDAVAPGTLAERNQPWTERLVALTTSLQACAGLALLVVVGVAVAVVAAATRAGLVARRHSIEIVHGLGAGDGYIAGRFARRTTGLALSGGIVGTVLSIPMLLVLCRLGAPFASDGMAASAPGSVPAGDGGAMDWVSGAMARVPLPLWIALPLLPPIAASIGWTTAQATVRTWLRRLP